MREVRKLRGYNSMTQIDLAKLLGVTRTTVAAIENPNTKKLSKNMTEKLCKIFNCSAVGLYGLDNLIEKPKDDDDRLLMINAIANTMDDKSRLCEVVGRG